MLGVDVDVDDEGGGGVDGGGGGGGGGTVEGEANTVTVNVSVTVSSFVIVDKAGGISVDDGEDKLGTGRIGIITRGCGGDTGWLMEDRIGDSMVLAGVLPTGTMRETVSVIQIIGDVGEGCDATIEVAPRRPGTEATVRDKADMQM